MTEKKKILAIIGSASAKSSNLRLVETIGKLIEAIFELTIFDDLKLLPLCKNNGASQSIYKRIEPIGKRMILITQQIKMVEGQKP